MFRIGSTIRSAKTNEATPPKLIPPFHRTAASGTFPIEQTNESAATIGPTSGPQSAASTGWSTKKNDCQNDSGTQAPSAPAISRPPTMSFQTALHSIAKEWLVAVKPAPDRSRHRTDPPETDMSIAA